MSSVPSPAFNHQSTSHQTNVAPPPSRHVCPVALPLSCHNFRRTIADLHLLCIAVLIRIAVMSPDDISLPDRRIILTEKHPSVEIGRSSNRPALALQPAVTNGWFDSPVMSRHHAEIRADIRNKASDSTILWCGQGY